MRFHILRSEAIGEIEAPAPRQGLEYEVVRIAHVREWKVWSAKGARRPLGVVFLVGEVASPRRDGPVSAGEPEAQVDQADGLALGEVVRIEPSRPGEIVVRADEEAQVVRRADRVAVLQARVQAVLRDEWRLVADVVRIAIRLLDLAVRVPVGNVAVEAGGE